MTRVGLLSIMTGFAISFLPLAANADQDQGATGGTRYGGAKVHEDTTVQQPLELQPAQAAPQQKTDIDVTVHETPAPPAPPVPRITVKEKQDTYYIPFGMSLSLGGGVTDFVDDKVQGMTDPGGAYEARLTLGTRSILGLEAAYVGSAQQMNALGTDPDAMLVGNGIEGLARLNFTRRQRIQPYVVGGVGWTRYNVVNENFRSSSIEDQDDIVDVPFGGGITARAGKHTLIDGRFTYRPTFNNNMFHQFGSADDTKLDNWGATVKLGYEF